MGLRLLFLWRLARVFLHVCTGVIIVALTFHSLSQPARNRLIRWWSRVILRLSNTTVLVEGALHADGAGTLLVVNHISWIDIYVVNVVRAARFVGKAELRDWPLIGYLCRHTGTIFIERGRRRAVLHANHAVSAALQQGELVVVFPEGTTSDGSQLLPFHSNLIEAARVVAAPVQPASLRYLDAQGNPSNAADYLGEMTLPESLYRLLTGGPTVARLRLLPVIESDGLDRHAVAAAARVAIGTSLGVATADS